MGTGTPTRRQARATLPPRPLALAAAAAAALPPRRAAASSVAAAPPSTSTAAAAAATAAAAPPPRLVPTPSTAATPALPPTPASAAPPAPPRRRRGKGAGQDARLYVEAEVSTEATIVTKFVECSRLFGTLASTKLVSGRVKEVIPGLQKDSRRKTDLRVAWVIQTRTVEKTLALRSVKAGFAPSPTPSPPPFGLEVGSPMTQASPAADARHEPDQPPLPSLGDALRADGAVSLEPPTPPTTVTAHGLTWAAGGVSEPVGGPVARRTWSVRTLPGEVIFEEGDMLGQTRTPYDYFLAMFPMDQLTRMVRLTSPALEGRGMQPTTRGELLKFIGVTILATHYEFGSRADLWSTKPRNPYLMAPAFGERTGLSRCRFDDL